MLKIAKVMAGWKINGKFFQTTIAQKLYLGWKSLLEIKFSEEYVFCYGNDQIRKNIFCHNYL